MKCLYELQDKDLMRSACKKFDFMPATKREISVSDVSFSPVDFNALFEFLSECEQETKLKFSSCKFLDNHFLIYLQLGKSNLLKNLNNVTSLYIESCTFGYHFWKSVSEALRCGHCELRKFRNGNCNIADDDAKYLSEVFKIANRTLSELSIS